MESDDPRNISDQSEEHSAEARGAQVELSPEERQEQVKSAAPDGGDIQELPDQPAAESKHDEDRAGARNGSDGESSSRVSVVDESLRAPNRPTGPTTTSTSGTPTRSIRQDARTPSSSSTPTSPSGAPTSCVA